MFHIVHSPRFTLLAPMKLTFGIDTRDQRFGYSSPIVNIDSVKLNSFGGKRCSFNSAVSWAAVL